MFSCNWSSSCLWKWAFGTSVVAGGGVVAYRLATGKMGFCVQQKTKGEVDNPYESIKLLNEYLAFNYGGPSVNCLFDGPQNGFDFPKRTADLCMKYYKSATSIPSRALDIGCAVGRASFELSQEFSEVVGIDFSHGFVKTCNALKRSGQMEYDVNTEGILCTKHEAVVPVHLKRERCNFQQGDACNLPLDLGKFGCVLAANLICRLPNPTDFIMRLSSLVAPGGICVITSPYTFLEDYTPKDKWLGGFVDKNGKEVRAIDTMKSLLSPHFELVDSLDVPFLIRETLRKHQWTVSHVTVWQRNGNK